MSDNKEASLTGPKETLIQHQGVPEQAKPLDAFANGCTVSIGARMEKLPLGQNLVTLVTNDPTSRPVINIKLPEAKNHHWLIIRVEGEKGLVQCPNSYLALKVDVLSWAAVMAQKENTNVRIPIAAKGEPDIFGVYAVPGLITHIFVGPFSNKLDRPIEIITLDVDDD